MTLVSFRCVHVVCAASVTRQTGFVVWYPEQARFSRALPLHKCLPDDPLLPYPPPACAVAAAHPCVLSLNCASLACVPPPAAPIPFPYTFSMVGQNAAVRLLTVR